MIDVVREGLAGNRQHDTQHLLLAISRRKKGIDRRFARIAALFHHGLNEGRQALQFRIRQRVACAQSRQHIRRYARLLVGQHRMCRLAIGAAIDATDRQQDHLLFGRGKTCDLPKGMPGCLISCVLADTAGASPLFRAELDRRFATMQGWIADRLQPAPETLQAPADVLAVVLASTARGLKLRARSGATAADLAPVARAAARSFAYSVGV